MNEKRMHSLQVKSLFTRIGVYATYTPPQSFKRLTCQYPGILSDTLSSQKCFSYIIDNFGLLLTND